MATDPPELHPFQRDFNERIQDAIDAGHRRVLGVGPTGSGKMVMAAAFIADRVALGQRALFLDHRRELTKQSSRKLHAFGVQHGIIQADFPPRPSERVQVAIAYAKARAGAS